MAKTESTAVTRLIELSQQRAVQGDLDWFAPPRPRRSPREEVTQVVRIARRALTVSPGSVLGAFLAGMLTVIVTTLVTRGSVERVAVPVAVEPVVTATGAATGTGTGAATGAATGTGTATGAGAATRAAAAAGAGAATRAGAATGTGAGAVVEAVAVAEPVAEPVAVEEPVAVAEPVVAPVRAPGPARARPAAFAPKARAVRPPPRDAGPLSELRINSKPPCEITIDGRNIGWTPQRGVTLSPGRHTIIFRNREQGVERKVLLDAKVGQVHRLIRDFTEP